MTSTSTGFPLGDTTNANQAPHHDLLKTGFDNAKAEYPAIEAAYVGGGDLGPVEKSAVDHVRTIVFEPVESVTVLQLKPLRAQLETALETYNKQSDPMVTNYNSVLETVGPNFVAAAKAAIVEKKERDEKNGIRRSQLVDDVSRIRSAEEKEVQRVRSARELVVLEKRDLLEELRLRFTVWCLTHLHYTFLINVLSN